MNSEAQMMKLRRHVMPFIPFDDGLAPMRL